MFNISLCSKYTKEELEERSIQKRVLRQQFPEPEIATLGEFFMAIFLSTGIFAFCYLMSVIEISVDDTKVFWVAMGLLMIVVSIIHYIQKRNQESLK